MCVVSTGFSMATLVGSALSAATTIVGNNIQRKNDEYKTQIAVNQIKSQQNEAQRQRQLGIDKSREEKIQGLKTVSKLKAINASNGFDTSSQTNLYNYDDTKNEYDYSANNILESYYSNAEKYDEQARNNISDLNFKNDTKKLNSIGSTLQVAEDWYKKGAKNGNF